MINFKIRILHNIMNKIVTNSLSLLLIIAMVSCGNSHEKNTNATVQSQVSIAIHVDATQFQELIKTEKGAIILDVRTPEEVAAGSIEERITIDFRADGFKEQLTKLDKDAPILVYCASGGRSGKTMEFLKEMGFKKVYNLSGGFNAWKSEGKPVK